MSRRIVTFVVVFLLLTAVLIGWDLNFAQGFAVGGLVYMACDTWISTWWPK